MRAKLLRLSDDLRACDLSVVASVVSAIDHAAVVRPDIILISATLAERHGDDVTRLADHQPQVPMLVTGDSGHVAGRAEEEASTSAEPPVPASAADLRATSELGVVFLALGGERSGTVTARDPALRRRFTGRAGSGMIAPKDLTEAEHEILRGLAVGATNAQVAASMGITETSVDGHLATIIDKLHGRRDRPARTRDPEPVRIR